MIGGVILCKVIMDLSDKVTCGQRCEEVRINSIAVWRDTELHL